MIDIKIYQINADRDENGVIFESYEKLPRWQKSQDIDASIYDLVYEGSVDGSNLEDVYEEFNFRRVENYAGRSISISDVVQVVNSDTVVPGFYYCDTVGFKDIEFDSELTQKPVERKIKVVMVEPGKNARVTEIGTQLDDLQRAVGGLIETYYPFPDEGYMEGCCIVCNDEGKFNGMLPNRAIYDENHELMDIIFGPFFICDASTENFGSLTLEQQEGFLNQFKNPERFFSSGGKIIAVPYEPVPVRNGSAR